MNNKDSPAYNTWRGMRSRCNNFHNKDWLNYGGKNISVCSEWDNFKAFEEWAFNNGFEVGLTLDRKNNNGNYEPGNCRWCTRKEQANNTSTNKPVTYKGKTKTISQWSDLMGINYDALYDRLYYGWPLERAFKELNSITL